MSVNVFEAVLFAQLDNEVLVSIAHDRENVIDAFSRNSSGQRFQYFHGDLRSSDGRQSKSSERPSWKFCHRDQSLLFNPAKDCTSVHLSARLACVLIENRDECGQRDRDAF
jgi:hypothetical protein